MAGSQLSPQTLDGKNLDVIDAQPDEATDTREAEAEAEKDVGASNATEDESPDQEKSEKEASDVKAEEGKQGEQEGEDDPEPPLESVELPELSFNPPPDEPPLESNDLPEVTYGSSDDEPDLHEAELPELTFDSPDTLVESVDASDGATAVVPDDTGGSPALVSDEPADSIEAQPQPDYPNGDDSADEQPDDPFNFHDYEITATPLFAGHEYTLEYADQDDDDEDDMGDD